MAATLALLKLLAGLALLVYGSQRVVDGSTSLAQAAGISVFFVGVTIVAIGSSLPEIATSVGAAVYGAGTIIAGHIVGSATSQITLGVGLVAFATPLAVSRHKSLTYGGGMLVAMAVMAFVVRSGTISHLEGVLMCLLYLGFLAVLFEHEDYAGHLERKSELSTSKAVVYVFGGLLLVIVGGHLLVTGAQAFARAAGVPEYLIGIVTGLGTTAPEIAVSLVAVRRDRSGIAIGTLLGSNITDTLFSLGLGAAIGGFQVVDTSGVLHSIGYMMFVSALIVAVLYWREEVGRWFGLGCLVLYIPVFLIG